jgi:DNA-binding CsgD family transcriptional regulator
VSAAGGSIVGRRAELDHIEAVLAAAADGQPRVLLLAGEAGCGKTALLGEAAARADVRGFAVGVGACADVGRGLPFAPVRAALRFVDGEAYAGTVAAAIARCPQLALLLPGAAVAAPDTTFGEHAAALLFEGVLDLVGEVGAQAPVLLALEDLHWADASTLELVAFLTRNLSGERVLLLGTMRLSQSVADQRLQELIAELQRLPLVGRVDVGGLPPDDLRELARRVTGREPDALLVEALHRRTDGNPFFAVELLRAGDRDGLPPTVRDALGAVLARLDPAGARVVRAAAAIGREVNADLLAAVLELPLPAVADGVRAAVEAGVLVTRDDDVLEFRHALLQEAAYATLVPLERRSLHVAIADHLRARPEWAPGFGLDALLAYHHDRAGQPEPAFVASLRAAQAALDAFGFAEAFTHLSRALDLWPLLPHAEELAGRDEVTVRVLASDAATWAGRLDDALAIAEDTLALVEPGADRRRWCELADRVAELRWLQGDMPGSLALLDAAAARLGGHEDTIEWARIHRRRAMSRLLAEGRPDGIDLVRRALEVARAVGDAEVEAAALDTLGCMEWALGDERGLAHLDEAFDLAVRSRNANEVIRAAINRMNALLMASRLHDAERAGVDGLAAIRALGVERAAAAEFMGGLPRAMWLRGAWTEAEDVLRSTLRAGWGRSDSYVDLSAAMLALGHGDVDEAERLLEEARRDLAGNQFNAGRWFMTLCQVRLVQGRAREAFEAATAALPQMMRTPGTWFAAITAYALEALHAYGGDAATATELRERAEERYARLQQRPAIPAETPAWMALVRAWHAEITGAGDPLPHWDAAAACFGELDYVVDVAWIDLQRARLLVEAGERARAAELVGAAHALALRIGARALRERLEDIARRARLAVPSIAAAPSAEHLGLTDREIEVLRHLAEGRTNKEIGEALFISTRTASVHVSNIIRKLGVTNRGEAAAVAHRHGLLVDVAGQPAR